MTTYASPPATCNVCDREIEDVFYDVYVYSVDSWANVCPRCFSELGCGIGPGRGQQYTLRDDDRYHKTAG